MNPFGTAHYFAEPHTKQRCCVWAVWQLQAKGSTWGAKTCLVWIYLDT